MSGYDETKKGTIVYRTPKFSLKDISPETNAQALELDKQLQDYLAGYFAKTKSAAAQAPASEQPQPDAPEQEPTLGEPQGGEPEPEPDDDTPF